MRRLPDLREIRATAVIVLLAGLGINVAAFLLINQPLADGLRNADQEVRQMMAGLESRRGRLDDLSEARDRIEEQVRDLGLFFDEVLSGKAERMVSVQREIREIAQRHRINPETIGYTHGGAEEGTDLVKFSASFPLRGNYEALRAFIRDVEHSRNFLVIDAIELTNSREGGVMLALAIKVSTIFRDPDYHLLRGQG